jgi:hypothetical protein
LERSAELGRPIVALLDLDADEVWKLRPEPVGVATIARDGGKSLNPDARDLDVTAGWGHAGKGGAVMPGKGRIVEREYTAEEREAIAKWIEQTLTDFGRGLQTCPPPGSQKTLDRLSLVRERPDFEKLLGERTCDVYLNGVAFWKNIPRGVWEYTIGGYQVIKKWLSYRERQLLKRGLKLEEARTVTAIARRIAAIIVMGPELDANYAAIKRDCHAWQTKN